MRHVVAIVAVIALGLGVVLAFGGGPGTDDACASSTDDIVWREVVYHSVGANRDTSRVRYGPRVGTGIAAASCGDVGRALFSIRGVDPAVAMAARGTADWKLYLAEGFPIVAEHPLHETVVGPLARPGGACGKPVSLEGTVERMPSFTRMGVRAAGRVHDITFRARTAIPEHRRAGLPFLRKGDRVRVTGRECRTDDDDGPALYATAIARP